ncbi:MAG: DNA alkylation repair protein [Holophagaceae bacterium]|nr:DNA alkylation repair protein [Holophagaceae bacterium]
MKPEMERWICDECLWIRRAALLSHCQKRRERTDEAQLFEHCLRLAPEKDFFIRKAIGWALREHGKTRPEAVRVFLETHRSKFSGLSIREDSGRIAPRPESGTGPGAVHASGKCLLPRRWPPGQSGTAPPGAPA